MISRSAYQDLITKEFFVSNNIKYDLDKKENKEDVSIDGKQVDTLHVIAEIWIVKNSEFPIIVKMIKNPLGINFTLEKVENK